MLGVRNTLYAVRLATLLRVPRSRRVLAAQVTIDETTAMAVTAPPGSRDTAFWVTGITIFITWNLATLLGALGAAVFDTNAIGLDAAVGAAFLALLAPQIHDWRGARVAIGGAARRSRGAGDTGGCAGDHRGARNPPRGRAPMTWIAIFATATACFGLKLAGWSLPARLLAAERMQRAAELLPLALLAALVVVQTFSDGRSLVIDARAAGLAAAGVAVLRRAPFIVVIVVAAATTAVVRAVT